MNKLTNESNISKFKVAPKDEVEIPIEQFLGEGGYGFTSAGAPTLENDRAASANDAGTTHGGKS